MTTSSRKLAFLTRNKSSERVLLWTPLIQNLSQEGNNAIFRLDSVTNESDEQNPLCKSEIAIIKEEDYSLLDQFDFVIIADTPDQIKAYSCEKIPVPYGCFFGGILSSPVNEQISAARKRKVHFLLSDLLISEIKSKLLPEDFKFFLNTALFSPPAGISSIEKSTSEGEMRCYLFDSSLGLEDDFLHHSIKTLYKEDENSEILDLAKIKSFDHFRTRLLNQNLKCILVHQLPVALMHFMKDLCLLNAIDLKILKEQKDLSFERTILSKQVIFGDSISRRIETNSLRKALEEVFSISENLAEPPELPITSEIYDLGIAIHKKFDSEKPCISQDSGLTLELFRANQDIIYDSIDDCSRQDEFSVLREVRKSEYIRNTIFHLDFLSEKIADKQRLEIEQELADQITELFIEEKTSPDLLNSFFKIIHSKEGIFLNSMKKEIHRSTKPPRKIKVLRLLFHCLLNDCFSDESIKIGIESISCEDIGNEFKLLIEMGIADSQWLNDHFMEIFMTCEKVRFFKYLNLYLTNSFNHHQNFLLFLKEIYPKTKENLSPLIYRTTDLITSILSPEMIKFKGEDLEQIEELEDVSLLFKLAIQAKIQKKLQMFETLLSRINKLDGSILSPTDNLILICLNLNSDKPDVIQRNCLEFIDKKDSFNALELHPIFYSLISWILSNQLENKQLIQQAELLYKKYKPIGIDVLQFFYQAPNLSIGNQDTLLEILKILSECLLESTG